MVEMWISLLTKNVQGFIMWLKENELKYIVNNQATQNKDLVYTEGFWSGKKTITYNGVELKKIEKNKFEYADGDKKEVFEIKGNSFLGVKINMFGQDVEVLRQLVWYEILLSVLVFLPGVIFWRNDRRHDCRSFGCCKLIYNSSSR